MKSAASVFFVCIIFTTAAFGVEIKPTNIVIPSSAGETFRFDIIVSPSTQNIEAQFAQLTIGSISGPSGLTFSSSESEAVKNDSSYWIFGNSMGATAKSYPDGSYSFDDGADNPPSAIINDKIFARFAFTWNGTAEDYIFNLDRNTSKSYIYLADFSTAPVTLPTGQWYSSPIIGTTDSSFTVHIPEPISIALLGLGGLAILRKHRR